MDLNGRAFSESLKNTLSCYQLSSADSLSGPSGYPALAARLWCKKNNQSPPRPRTPVIQIPVLMTNDTSTQRSETILSGERISCFIVGGEKRLCLPQILTTVLKVFTIQEINKTCAELHIYCSRCSPEQLEILKVLGILPFNTTQCGLITKTDAERLVAALGAEYHMNGKHDFISDKSKGILVYHECFGQADGVFYSDLYTTPDSCCIACLDCRSTFSPSRFVSHSHRSLEKRTCHWGFDRDNWRHYLLTPRHGMDDIKYKEMEKRLDHLKARFDPIAQAETYNASNLKRRMKAENEVPDLLTKRMKEEKEEDRDINPATSAGVHCFGLPFPIHSTAFKPWPAALPPGLTSLADLQAAQEAVFFKTMMQDRRLLPGLIPVSNSVNAFHSAQGWPKLVEAQSGNLAPVDLHRKGNDVTSSVRNDAREGYRLDKHARERTAVVKKEGVHDSGSYPTPYRRVSDDANRSSSWNRDHASEDHSSSDFALADRRSLREDRVPCVIGASKNKNKDYDNERREDADKSPTSALDLRSEVAAASAMLQLSSSVDEKKTSSDSSPRRLSDDSPKKTTSSHSSELDNPQITALSPHKQHYKWKYAAASYILSSAATKQMADFELLLESIPAEKKHPILREVVRMKSESEQKLDVQRRMQQELQLELERIANSRQRCIEQADDAKKELLHEIERIREEHHREMKEKNESVIELGKQLADLRMHATNRERDALQHKFLDRLHKQVDDREEEIRKLERQLLEERDQRIVVERKLEDLAGIGMTLHSSVE